MEEEIRIMRFISIWNWFILSVIFLISSFIMVFSGEDLGNNIMFVAFIMAWVICLIISMARKTKLDKEIKNE